MEFLIAGKTLALAEGDITEFRADAIGNAANEALVGGSGVNGAILAAGGPALESALAALRDRVRRCPTGEAVITPAGALPAAWVLHCVGPVYETGKQGEADLLAGCYRAALRLAQEKGAKTVAMPSISTGVYGYPIEEAAEVSLRAVARTLESERCTIERVTFVLFGQPALESFAAVARRLFA